MEQGCPGQCDQDEVLGCAEPGARAVVGVDGSDDCFAALVEVVADLLR
jgi:hypothetical protein